MRVTEIPITPKAIGIMQQFHFILGLYLIPFNLLLAFKCGVTIGNGPLIVFLGLLELST